MGTNARMTPRAGERENEREDDDASSSSEAFDDDAFVVESEDEETDADVDEDASDDDDDDDEASDDDDEEEGSDEDELLARPMSNQMMGMSRAFASLVGDGDEDGDAEMLPKSRKQREDEREAKAEEKERKERKRAKLEIKNRGHVKPQPRGRDVESDMLERRLQNTATKGVVRLFKAVSKAQEDSQKARLMRRKDALISKTKFLEELRGGDKTPAAGEEEKASRASFLQDDFMLSSGGKMKDWDKEREVAARDLEYDEEEDDVF
ncbi:Rrp15p-domain-containing protein [Ostreococcus tauri]|uniref:Rrp15p-domain-containing protein n=1 Tax=Ostreococcus tauri TaxID=70448 RepID=A0A1Y5I6Z0_OSTTA|nr:Rrp15p-domain-containing protein [Ostreococcus tauri]